MSESEKNGHEYVEMPTPTAWPLVFALGVVLFAAGVGLHLGFFAVGLAMFAFGVRGWIAQLIPGAGHMHEELAPASERPSEIRPAPGTVEPLKAASPGYRFRLPEHVHPLSSGAKGGLLGGIAMAVPAMLYGAIDQGSPWLPINLLAGLVIPGAVDANITTLREFQPGALALATVIHVSFSITFGLMYGVILPMLPTFRGSPLVFGGIVMPIIWSGVCYGLMGVVDPALEQHVKWRWFVASQFVYGLVMSYVVDQTQKVAVSQAPPLKGGARFP